MSNSRRSSTAQPADAQQDESPAVAGDSPEAPATLAAAREAIVGMPYGQLVRALAALMYDDNPDVQHATWDALVAAAR